MPHIAPTFPLEHEAPPRQGLARFGPLIVAFVCGWAGMVLEIDAPRIFAPFVGNSIIVWTALIGVTLVGLSLGYWIGGVWADRKSATSSSTTLMLAAAVAIGAIPPLRIPVFAATSPLSSSIRVVV